LKTPDGIALDLDNYRTMSTPTTLTTCRADLGHLTGDQQASKSEDQRKQRLAEEEEQKEKEKAKLRADKEERTRKETEAMEPKLRK
jgi:hypothetical protein